MGYYLDGVMATVCLPTEISRSGLPQGSLSLPADWELPAMSDGEGRLTVKLHWLDYHVLVCFLFALRLVSVSSFHDLARASVLKPLQNPLLIAFGQNLPLHLLSRQSIRGCSAKNRYSSFTNPHLSPHRTTAACCINLSLRRLIIS